LEEVAVEYYMEVVETAQADTRTVDCRTVGIDNGFVRMGILVNPLVVPPSNQMHVFTIIDSHIIEDEVKHFS
jgi:hypothetical protein